MQAYFAGTPQIFPLSALIPSDLSTDLGLERPLYIGLPALIGDQKVQVQKPDLSETEHNLLAFSARKLQSARG
jgi:malate/lactate dehydrogenase